MKAELKHSFSLYLIAVEIETFRFSATLSDKLGSHLLTDTGISKYFGDLEKRRKEFS